MTIDTSGKWWKGSSFEDVTEYITLYMADSYPVKQVVQSICSCGNSTFTLKVDQEEGCAQRTCTVCNQSAFIGDSDEIREDAHPKKIRCPCKNTTFEIGVGFSFRDDEENIKWVTLGHRCTRCGILASSADWEINYGPSLHLLNLA
jgi:hypothetical protein